MTHLIFVSVVDGACKTAQADTSNSKPLSGPALGVGHCCEPAPAKPAGRLQTPVLARERGQQQPQFGGGWGGGYVGPARSVTSLAGTVELLIWKVGVVWRKRLNEDTGA